MVISLARCRKCRRACRHTVCRCAHCAPALSTPTAPNQPSPALCAIASLAKGCARRRVSRPTAPKGRLLGRDEGDRRTAVEGFPAGTSNILPSQHTGMVHRPRRGRCPHRPVPRRHGAKTPLRGSPPRCLPSSPCATRLSRQQFTQISQNFCHSTIAMYKKCDIL